MYGIYANIGGILMVNVTIYIAYMDPMDYRWCLWDSPLMKDFPAMTPENPRMSPVEAQNRYFTTHLWRMCNC